MSATQIMNAPQCSSDDLAGSVGKPCEKGLHELVIEIEKSIKSREFHMDTFPDIAGTISIARLSSIDSNIVNWIE